MRLLFFGLVLVVLSSACSMTSANTEPGREYSGAFANWFYQTNEVAIEAGAVQEALVENYSEEGIRNRLRELAITQMNLNARFAATRPHPFWAQSHPAIIEAIEQFDDATATLRGNEPVIALASAADAFRLREDALLQAIISCYAQTDECPK